MKKLKGLLVIAAISCLLFASCKQDPAPEDNPEKGNTTEESSETKNDNPPKEEDDKNKEETTGDDTKPDQNETSEGNETTDKETSEEKNPEKETTEAEPGKSAFTITYSTSDISIEKSEANGKITLTASSDFTDYEWKLDGATVSSKNVLEITGKTAGTYVYELTAKKNNELYSACVYVVIK